MKIFKKAVAVTIALSALSALSVSTYAHHGGGCHSGHHNYYRNCNYNYNYNHNYNNCWYHIDNNCDGVCDNCTLWINR